MPFISDDTFVRPRNLHDRTDPAVIFARSYLTIRTAVGLIGIALPLMFIVGEACFLDGQVHIRGSVSAYYYTSMRDCFVGALCVIGVLLITYMSGQTRRTDYWLSLLAGVAVLGLAFLPTERPDLAPGAARCGAVPVPVPPGCTAVQQMWGEALVATIHFTCALIFILCLAAICFYFAHRERTYDRNPRMAGVQVACGWVIIGAVAWATFAGPPGWNIGELTPIYIGEVVSIWSFGVSWLLKGRDVWRVLNDFLGHRWWTDVRRKITARRQTI